MSTEVMQQNFDEMNLDEVDSDLDEDFQDVDETLPEFTEEDLLAAMDTARKSFFQFLNDEPDKALSRIDNLRKGSVYQALGYSAFTSVHACLAFEKKDIDDALTSLRECAILINRRRHKNTLTNNMVTKMVIRPNYNSYTEEEIHAELVYAESLILRGLMNFLQRENLISYIKGGLRIRKAHAVYKECQDILEYRTWKNTELKQQFEAGVDLGLGLFNLVVSALPPRILKFLQFIGFSGERDYAIERLTSGHKKFNTLRGAFCTLALLIYNSEALYILSYPKNNDKVLQYCEELLQPLFKESSKGPVTQYFAGRLEHIRGNLSGAVEKLENVLKINFAVGRFQHLSVFELSWINMAIGDYRKSANYMGVMCSENQWSKTIFYYLKGCALAMCKDRSQEEEEDMINCMREVPQHIQRFLGKSLPVEKYCKRRAKRFFAEGNWLPLPVFVMEMMYAANYFYLVKGKNDILETIMVEVDRAIIDLQEGDHKDSAWHVDNYCLAVFLKGLCLYYMGYPLSAEEYFLEVVQNQQNIVKDVHVVSFALMELGYICIDTGNNEQAVEYLSAARAASVFITEFRIHSGLEDLRRQGYYYDPTCDRDDWN